MSNPVVHWEIGATDASKLETFYTEAFGWEITPAGPEYALVLGADGGIGGGILQVSEGMPPYLTLYVDVDDLESSLSNVVRLGASEVVPPTSIPGVGRFALFEDPDGHILGLLESVPGPE